MSYLFGAFFCCLISVRCLNQGRKIYVEMKGPVTKAVSILYTFAGVGAFGLAYHAVGEFYKVGW